ncbi:unnamed protein product [Rotaria magnacalcarata]
MLSLCIASSYVIKNQNLSQFHSSLLDLLVGAVLTQAFNCYECWSVMVPGCGEPFKSDAAGVTVKSATSNQSCIALRETHVDGNEGIARAVVDLTECTFGSVQLVLLNIFIWYAWFTILLGIASSELIKINIQV